MRGTWTLAPVVVVLGALVGCRGGTRSLVAAPPTTSPSTSPSMPVSSPNWIPVAPSAVVVYPPTPHVDPATTQQPELPPDARPGEVWCYIRVPAVTQTVTENVLIAPASCREEPVPPVTKEVVEQVLVRPEERRKLPVPAEFEEREEQVLVSDTKAEWRKVDCQPKNMNAGEQVGECWTLVQRPALYTTRTSRVCVKPESFREEVLPAQYASQARTVVVQEGYTKKIEIPPVYEVRSRDVEVSPARWEWRRTDECETPPLAPEGAGSEPVPVPTAPVPPAPAAQPGAIPSVPAYDLPPAGSLPPVPLPSPAR